MEPLETGTGTILVDRFHVHVALARPGLGADDLGEKGFRCSIAVEDIVLAALLVIDDELHGDIGALRPVRIGSGAAIALEIAGVVLFQACSSLLKKTARPAT